MMTHFIAGDPTQIRRRIDRIEELLNRIKATGPGDVLKSHNRVLKRYALGERPPFEEGLVVDMLVNYSFNNDMTEYEEQVILIVSGNGSATSVTYDSVEAALRVLEMRT